MGTGSGVTSLSFSSALSPALPIYERASSDPIGLVNPAALCWLNSAIQFILSDEYLTRGLETVLAKRVEAFAASVSTRSDASFLIADSLEEKTRAAFDRIIREKSEAKKAVSSVTTQPLHKYLVALGSVFDEDPMRQNDMEEALFHLLRPSDIPAYLGKKLVRFQHDWRRVVEDRDETIPLVREKRADTEMIIASQTDLLDKEFEYFLNVSQPAASFFDRLRASFSDIPITKYGFEEGDEEGKEFLYEGLEKTQFTSPPSHFLLTFIRFANEEGHLVKVNSLVPDIPLEFSFDADWTPSHRVDRFALTAFTVHLGSSLEAGHYICYVKHNGRWFCCDDASITPVESEALIQDVLATRTTYCHLYQNLTTPLTVETFSEDLLSISSIPPLTLLSSDEISLGAESPQEETTYISDEEFPPPPALGIDWTRFEDATLSAEKITEMLVDTFENNNVFDILSDTRPNLFSLLVQELDEEMPIEVLDKLSPPEGRKEALEKTALAIIEALYKKNYFGELHLISLRVRSLFLLIAETKLQECTLLLEAMKRMDKVKAIKDWLTTTFYPAVALQEVERPYLDKTIEEYLISLFAT